MENSSTSLVDNRYSLCETGSSRYCNPIACFGVLPIKPGTSKEKYGEEHHIAWYSDLENTEMYKFLGLDAYYQHLEYLKDNHLITELVHGLYTDTPRVFYTLNTKTTT